MLINHLIKENYFLSQGYCIVKDSGKPKMQVCCHVEIQDQLDTAYLSKEVSSDQRDVSYCHPYVYSLDYKFRFKEFVF